MLNSLDNDTRLFGTSTPTADRCGVCRVKDATICDDCSSFPGEFPDLETTDTDRAFQILTEAVTLYENLQNGVMMAAAAENLKSAAELTGIQPCIIQYARRFGTLRAHNVFLKKQFQAKSPESTPPTPSPPSPNVSGGE